MTHRRSGSGWSLSSRMTTAVFTVTEMTLQTKTSRFDQQPSRCDGAPVEISLWADSGGPWMTTAGQTARFERIPAAADQASQALAAIVDDALVH